MSAGDQLKEEGNKAFVAGKYGEAVNYYTKAIEQDGDNAIYYSNRANAYLEAGYYPECI